MVIESLLLECKRNARSYILAPAFSPATISFYIELVLREGRAGTFTCTAHLILITTCGLGKTNSLAPPTSGKTEMYVNVCPLPAFASEELCTQAELAASPRRPDIWERLMVEPAVGSLRKLLCTPSHLSSSEGRRLFLRDFINSRISRMSRRWGEGEGGST